MPTESQPLRWFWRATLIGGVVVGLTSVVYLALTGPDPTEPGSTISETATTSPTSKVVPPPRTPPKLGTPKGKELRTADGEAYPFIERPYEPAHRLPLLGEPVKPTELSTPEEVVTSLASAIRQLDWRWFLSLWDPESRAYMVEAMRKANFAPARRLAQWRRNYVGKEMRITRRIDMGGYALVSMSPTDGAPETWTKVPPLTTKRDPSGRWWLTHDLRAHPIQSMGLALDPVTIIDRGPGP